LVVWVSKTISNHERLEVELGYRGDWSKVKSSVVLVDGLTLVMLEGRTYVCNVGDISSSVGFTSDMEILLAVFLELRVSSPHAFSVHELT
jgi:hypothetical protein